MRRLLGRALFVGAAAAASIALTAGTASAHFCYVENANGRAVQGMADSNGFVAFGELASFFLPELCEDGIEHLADAAGVTTGTAINAHAVMAGGTLKKEQPSSNGISHLDFEALDAAIPDAFALCAQ